MSEPTKGGGSFRLSPGDLQRFLSWLSNLCEQPADGEVTIRMGAPIVRNIVARLDDETLSMFLDLIAPRRCFLFLSSDPQERDAHAEEYQTICEALSTVRVYKSVCAFRVEISEIQQLIADHSPEFVHFAGHGTSGGELTLFDNLTFSAEDFVHTAFGRSHAGLRCVTMSACHTDTHAHLVAQTYAPAAIGYVGEVDNERAVHFASVFYTHIARGAKVADAFEKGRTSTGLGKSVCLYFTEARA